MNGTQKGNYMNIECGKNRKNKEISCHIDNSFERFCGRRIFCYAFVDESR